MSAKTIYTCDKCKEEVDSFTYSINSLGANLDFCALCTEDLKKTVIQWVES